MHFLDEKGTIRQTDFRHPKAPIFCASCSAQRHLRRAVFELGGITTISGSSTPVFVPKDEIVRKIQADVE